MNTKVVNIVPREPALGTTGFCTGNVGSGGIFQIEHLSSDFADFQFYGWNKDIRRNSRQLIEVRLGNNKDIRIAVEVVPTEGELLTNNNRVETILSVRRGGVRVAYFDVTRPVVRSLMMVNGAFNFLIAVLILIYIVAAWFNLHIPLTGVAMRPLREDPNKSLVANLLGLLPDFWQCSKRLWADKLGQISLATTTLGKGNRCNGTGLKPEGPTG